MNEWLDNTTRLSLEARRLEKKYAPSANDEGYREYHATAVVREQTNHKKYKQITHFQAALENISSTLRNMENDKLDCVYFQNLLEGFESKLSIFKATMAKEFEELIYMEQHLCSDLSTLEEHIDQTMIKATVGAHEAKTSSEQTRKQQEEVKQRNEKISAHKTEIGAIERKLTALGDRLGGWDSRDHDIFIRLWTQHVGPAASGGGSGGYHSRQKQNQGEPPVEEETKENEKEKKERKVLDLGSKTAYLLRRRLAQAVQMKSEEEIEEHLLWFVEVDELQSRKKEILSVWKREKERERPDTLSSAAPCSPVRETSAVTLAMSDRKREINKQKLAKWQRDKEEEKTQKELCERRQQEEKRQAQNREKAERQQSNRVLVQNWVEERKTKDSAVAAASARPHSAKLSSANLDSLRRKQEQEIDKAKTRRVQLNTARERAASTGRMRRQKELAETTTDPTLRSRVKSKLHEPTKVSLASRLTAEDLEARERQRSRGSAHNARVVSGGYDLKFSGRAIPAWTRGAGLT